MKDVFNRDNIALCGRHIAAHHTGFDSKKFNEVATNELENRELKDRANQICKALSATLPKDFAAAKDILLASLRPVEDNQELSDVTTDEEGVAGWMILPYSQFIGEHGQHSVETSLDALKLMTKRFSSEFGIRYFFLEHPKVTLEIVARWTQDPCHHVRRLVSEGCRPLLPWAMQLPDFKQDPTHILPLLEALKDDPSEYVRRSVANNLNDIAKNHPQWVADLVEQWMVGADKHRVKLIKHGCRTLVKQGQPKVLRLFGFTPASAIESEISVLEPSITLGDSLAIGAVLTNTTSQESKLLLDFVVYHKKANGKLAPKVFKWKELTLAANATVQLEKSHPIKAITTRKYYTGEHQVALQINGEVQPPIDFYLTC